MTNFPKCWLPTWPHRQHCTSLGQSWHWGRRSSNFSRQETVWHIANMTSFSWNGDSAKSVLLVWFYRKWPGLRFNYYEYYTKESHWLFERKTIKSDVEKNDRSPSYICDLKMKKVFVCSNPLLSPSWLTLTVPHRSGWENNLKSWQYSAKLVWGCTSIFQTVSRKINCYKSLIFNTFMYNLRVVHQHKKDLAWPPVLTFPWTLLENFDFLKTCEVSIRIFKAVL